MKTRAKGAMPNAKSPKATRTASPKHNDHPLSKETDPEKPCSWCGKLPKTYLAVEQLKALPRPSAQEEKAALNKLIESVTSNRWVLQDSLREKFRDLIRLRTIDH